MKIVGSVTVNGYVNEASLPIEDKPAVPKVGRLWLDASGDLKICTAVTNGVATWELLTNEGEPSTSGTGVKVAVIGDSLSTQNQAMAPTWPSLLESSLRQSTVNVTVHNFAVAASTFYRAMNDVNNGMTQVQKAIAVNPQLIIVALGLNDTVTAVDGRTVAQAKSDADTLFAALRAGAPSALILYMREIPYDADNFTNPGTTLYNKGVTGSMYALRTSGILQGCYSTEILGDDVGATMRGRVADWVTLDAYVRGKIGTLLDASGPLNLFKVHRMGGAVYDMLHITAAGQVLFRAYAILAIKNNPAIAALFPNHTAVGTAMVNDPDALFLGMFTKDASSNGWTYNGTVTNALSTMDSLWKILRPINWYLPRDVKWQYTHFGGKTLRLGADLYWARQIQNAKPNTIVQTSLNGGSFSGTTIDTSSIVTDSQGCIFSGNAAMSLASLGVGTVTLRYKIDNIVIDPLTLTITAEGAAPTLVSTSRNVAVTDCGNSLTCTSSVTLTIQNFATVPTPMNMPIMLIAKNGAQFTIAAGSGVTILKRSDRGLSTISGYTTTVAELRRIDTNTWLLYGDLS